MIDRKDSSKHTTKLTLMRRPIIEMILNCIRFLGEMVFSFVKHKHERRNAEEGMKISQEQIPSASLSVVGIDTEAVIEKKNSNDNSKYNDIPGQQEGDDSVEYTESQAETGAAEKDVQSEMIKVTIELDLGTQFKGILFGAAEEGINDINVDTTVAGRFGNVSFSCNKDQLPRLVKKFSEISPPIRLGNYDNTKCISEFKKQLEMAQQLHQLKTDVPH